MGRQNRSVNDKNLGLKAQSPGFRGFPPSSAAKSGVRVWEARGQTSACAARQEADSPEIRAKSACLAPGGKADGAGLARMPSTLPSAAGHWAATRERRSTWTDRRPAERRTPCTSCLSVQAALA